MLKLFRKFKKSKFGINIAGYINTESGVGEGVRGVIRSLETTNIPFNLINIDQKYLRKGDKTYSNFADNNPYDINLIHINADQVPNFVNNYGKKFLRGKYNIGYWAWELSKFPDRWKTSFKYLDEIWAPSKFCAKALFNATRTPIMVMPHAISVKLIKKYTKNDFNLPLNKFIFLFVFDFRSFCERKNPMGLISAFKWAFENSFKNVLLVLKLVNTETNPGCFKQIKFLSKILPIKIVDKYIAKDDLSGLISVCDCYVSLHRSEGFGLPLAEAMYLKKPVIATNYSGNIDFMNKNNSFLVDYKLVKLKNNIGPYKNGNTWAEPNTWRAVKLMRWIFENKEEAKKIGAFASKNIKSNFSPENLGKVLDKRINEIYNK